MADSGAGSELGPGGYPLPAFFFEVIIGSGGDTSFQEVTGIKTELELESVAEGGENRFLHRLPKAVKHPNLVLKRGIAKRDSALVKWCKEVLEQEFTKPIETRELQVRLLNEQKEAVRAWSFVNAYPVSWEVESFNSTKNEVAIEKIELAYSHSERSD
ncbi:MAG: phage tail protein [Chromatiaceae bacterium]|nr:phage tail protein [Gammaproteobacteria bacterium]MCB1874232.1 phage tail protein [Gammaproteobacteria bacterium]MCB1878875.1 phage tail protein [Gammaproteobacteria bacterium]MCB1903791.1 phage tail protein [Gammaproteobacteria bacterium]MCP5447032.1 phage tail protein [Chromatiaceae bacterium]